MSLTYLFHDSAALYPEGGVRLSPAECAFLAPTVEHSIQRTQAFITEKGDLGGMHSAHIEAMQFILDRLKEGEKNKPQT